LHGAGLGCGKLRGCSAPKSRWSSLSLCPRLSCECLGQGHRQPSVLCLLYSFLGHICNTVGALLASQLGIQVGKALCGRVGTPPAPCPPSAAAVGLTPACQRCYSAALGCWAWRGEDFGSLAQGGMANAAVVGGCELLPEVLHFGEVQPPCAVIVSLPRSSQAPTWLWPMSSASWSPSFPRARLSPIRYEPVSHAGLPRRRRRRWRRLRGGLLALTLPLSVGAGRSLLAPSPWPSRGQLKGARRRLLGAVFEGFCWDVCAGLSPDPFSGQAVKEVFPCFPCFFSLPQDNREALGFVLGLLSAFVALTARIPALSRAVSVCWARLLLCPPVPDPVAKLWKDAGCPCPLHSPSWLFSPWGSCRVWHSSPLPRGLQGPRASCSSVPSRGQGPWLQSRLWVAQCRGKPRQWRRLWATLCSAAASVLYAAAIVTYNQQPAHILRALPWLLVALGSAALDVVLLFVTCTAKSQMGQRLVPEVPDAWVPLAGDGEEGDRRAVEEEVFSSLWLKSGKESCPAQQCYCSATPGEGGGMLGAGATQRRGQRVSMLQGMAGTGNITLTTGPHAFSCYADLGAAWHWCAAPRCSLSPSGHCKGGGWWGSLVPPCTLWKVGRAWLQDPDVSAQHCPAPTQVPQFVV
ncbi:uncharacterized protein ACIBXB_021963, partial [Morphnus guianensis]